VILDTPAVIATIFGEPSYEDLVRSIAWAGRCRLSAASLLEASIVAESIAGDRGIRLLDSFLHRSTVIIEPVNEEQALLAPYSDYGKGRHSAGLPFGDCFSYALAKATGEPLLFKGDNFRKTDVPPALPSCSK
jgi:ribonuclease VapC